MIMRFDKYGGGEAEKVDKMRHLGGEVSSAFPAARNQLSYHHRTIQSEHLRINLVAKFSTRAYRVHDSAYTYNVCLPMPRRYTCLVKVNSAPRLTTRHRLRLLDES
jgi:hypothetical protein